MQKYLTLALCSPMLKLSKRKKCFAQLAIKEKCFCVLHKKNDP